MSKRKTEDAEAGIGHNADPLTDDRILHVANEFERLSSDNAETRGELGSLLKQFEEEGGEKQALKLAVKLRRLEDSKSQNYWRSLTKYLRALGVFNQLDLLDPVPGQPTPLKSVA